MPMTEFKCLSAGACDNKELARQVTAALAARYPVAECSLEYGGDPWRLLVMGRLSAQCTDARVNIVCRELFFKYPTAEAMAAADISKLEEILRPCGLFRTKARDVRAASEMLCREFGGVLPDNMEELLRLPGVGRKVANLLLGDIYAKPGIVADTHCIRICGRLGFYPEDMRDPRRVERIMGEIVEPAEQTDLCHRLVMFGRDVCRARDPKCGECPLREMCRAGRGAG